MIASSGTLLGYRYEGSDIIVADNTAESADDPRRYSPVARPGHRAPHAWLENGDALYDRFGAGFTLLHLGARDAEVAAFQAAAIEIGMPFEVLNLNDLYVRQIYQSNLILIRPDLMIAWRENPQDLHETITEPRAILDCVRGS